MDRTGLRARSRSDPHVGAALLPDRAVAVLRARRERPRLDPRAGRSRDEHARSLVAVRFAAGPGGAAGRRRPVWLRRRAGDEGARLRAAVRSGHTASGQAGGGGRRDAGHGRVRQPVRRAPPAVAVGPVPHLRGGRRAAAAGRLRSARPAGRRTGTGARRGAACGRPGWPSAPPSRGSCTTWSPITCRPWCCGWAWPNTCCPRRTRGCDELLDDLHATSSAALADMRTLVEVLRAPGREPASYRASPKGLPAALDCRGRARRRNRPDVSADVDPAVAGLDTVRGLACCASPRRGWRTWPSTRARPARRRLCVRLAEDGAATDCGIPDGAGRARRAEPARADRHAGAGQVLGGRFDAGPTERWLAACGGCCRDPGTLVDDQQLVRAGLRMLCESSRTWRWWARPRTARRRYGWPSGCSPTWC